MFFLLTMILLLNNMFNDNNSTKIQDDINVKVVVPDIIHPYDDVPIVLVVTNNSKKNVYYRNPSYYWNSHPRLYYGEKLIGLGIRVKPDPKARKIIETLAPGEIRRYCLPDSFNVLYNTGLFKDGIYSFSFILELKDGTYIISETTVFTFYSN